MAKKIIVVFGATGAQGGGLANAILNDPRFADPENGDFRLNANSPAAHAGDASPAGDSSDYLGAFPPGIGKDKFWWTGKFPPEIDIENYGK